MPRSIGVFTGERCLTLISLSVAFTTPDKFSADQHNVYSFLAHYFLETHPQTSHHGYEQLAAPRSSKSAMGS